MANRSEIMNSPVTMDPGSFRMKGEAVRSQNKYLKDLQGLFRDTIAFDREDPETLAYNVQAWFPVQEGMEGGLFFGISTIRPGKVGEEYFMTRGHFHLQSDRAEIYWGVSGQGMLILMDRNRHTWAEVVTSGSLHYIGAETAHRLANTGEEDFVVGACWPSDAGHDYGEIAINGFSARLLERDGRPVLIPEDR